MPARTLNDFFAGFFYGQNKENLQRYGNCSTDRQKDWRKSNRRQSRRRKDNVEAIKIGGQGDKGQEGTVRYETPPKKGEINVQLV
jgi:hypothetical protein